ncbi:MAG: tRNA uridine-5-carboxymethylaminomethyl(34) synthesis GTPase MnmE [Oscillospiraceae bacterium]|nr:tRNA uridine-5-carboxymethylaminomethyl(34) synthesis GTPase MnmE [Oscillospiraceae bacterium]
MNDTIAAPATASAPAAVGVLRISGPDAERVAGRVFSVSSGLPFEHTKDRVLTGGVILDGGAALDRCMACVMRAPRSYTGENVVELYTHGSPAVAARTLELLYEAGARPARPGEFTRRAVLNGKLDLIQAEAVADLIAAETPAAARNAAAQLGGSVSRRIERAWELLSGVMSHVAACVDYPEDDVPELTAAEITDGLREASDVLSALAATYKRGALLRDGADVVIAGSPNTGKSSLFNALLGRDRSIVAPVPGTTRDAVEARVTLNGMRFNLIDTAGVRDADDAIEAEGVRRTELLIGGADAAMVVLDATREPDGYDGRVLDMTAGMPRVVVLNKCDLGGYPDAPRVPALRVSALTGEGIDALSEALVQAAPRMGADETLITNARQAAAVGEAIAAADECREAIAGGVPADAALCALESALDILAELTGRRASQEVLEQIFSRFCVGK